MADSIDINGLSKSYGAVTVLNDISLTVNPGEFLVFLGPSGCGKSTLLRMIAGLEDVSQGSISLGGERIDTLPPGQRGVAMVFQSYALYPHMTVAQNIGFGLENIKMAKADIQTRVQNAAETLEIAHLLDRKPAKLSGGQRQRVAIGRAIVKEPKAFLFDEPLSNLDAALRGRTRLELAQLHQRLGATMIFVTHDQVEAMTLADRIVIMHDKKIEQVGAPMEIYQRPASRFVAEFVGSPTISILPISTYQQQASSTVLTISGAGDVASAVALPADFDANGATIGVRAEDTKVLPSAEAGLTFAIKVVERLGDRSLLYGTLADGSDLVVEDSGRSTLGAGDTINVGFDPAAVHIFDGQGRAYHQPEAV